MNNTTITSPYPASLDRTMDRLIEAINARGSESAWEEEYFWRWIIEILSSHPENKLGDPQETGPLKSLEDLPAVTTDTFRFRAPIHPKGAQEGVLDFRTSGTTSATRGRHLLYRDDIYRTSAVQAFNALVLKHYRPQRLVSLVPRREEAKHSSLSYMIHLFEDALFPGKTDHMTDNNGIDLVRAGRALMALSKRGTPALVFSTSLAAHELISSLPPVKLPPGSLFLTTGGFKGINVKLDEKELDLSIKRHFGGVSTGSEYGMTELLSQGYRLNDNDYYTLPPWCRVLSINPLTGKSTARGEVGLLRFVDLANAQSAICVQTADLGRALSHHSFQYTGRVKSAPVRGCSLTYQELSGGS